MPNDNANTPRCARVVGIDAKKDVEGALSFEG